MRANNAATNAHTDATRIKVPAFRNAGPARCLPKAATGIKAVKAMKNKYICASVMWLRCLEKLGVDFQYTLPLARTSAIMKFVVHSSARKLATMYPARRIFVSRELVAPAALARPRDTEGMRVTMETLAKHLSKPPTSNVWKMAVRPRG
jgi:hypothetical protein